VVKYNHWIFKLPYINRFAAMTVSPHIYVKGSKLHPLVKLHEEVHLKQQKNRWYFFSYYLPVYLLKWIKGIFTYGFTMGAYYSIDWEREAYVLITPGVLSRLGYPELDTNPFDVSS
jgi:hypothetical protein